ncbi:hypothetical protein [Rhizobium sp. CF142]|uniref:hypothetical protein n=1 Tax=Rhizobium sp. CF142 TaxID=1144314 RepID=UPI00026EEFC8|nr:hypothetical protein [Rhizobium sp. CF142]EJJ26506.1 hypothetical protein PMI11_05140 [Rhizobium sp. CF142]
MLDVVYKGLLLTENCLFIGLLTRPLIRPERERRRAANIARLESDCAAALHAPLQFAWDPYKPWHWPPASDEFFSLDHLTVKVPALEEGKWVQLAYVKFWLVGPRLGDRRTAAIGHFVTETHNMQKGMGYSLARALFVALHERYGVTRIEFQVNHEKPGHAPFLARLGAVYVPPGPDGDRHWVWQYDQLDHYRPNPQN